MEHAILVCRVFTTKTTPGHGLCRKILELLTYLCICASGNILHKYPEERTTSTYTVIFHSLALLCRMKKE